MYVNTRFLSLLYLCDALFNITYYLYVLLILALDWYVVLTLFQSFSNCIKLQCVLMYVT